MGCCGVPVLKEFYKFDEAKKQEIIKEMEIEDNNIQIFVPKAEYENYNWDDLLSKIPSEKQRKNDRLNLFKYLNKCQKSYISTKKLKNNLTEYLNLPEIVVKKDPIGLASKAAVCIFTRTPSIETILEWREFRFFLIYLKQYFTYWKFFLDKKKSVEESLSLEEFKEIIPQIKNFGVEFKEDEIEKEFERMVNDEQGITFDGFCCDIIQNNFAKDKDDHFDDDKLDEFNNK